MTERREFAARQAGFLNELGVDAEEAGQRLKTVIGETELAAVMQATEGAQGPVIDRLFALGGELGIAREALLPGVHRLRHELMLTMAPVWRVFRGLMAYIGAMAIFVALILFVFVGQLIPSMGDMYDSLGADLPALTLAVMQSSSRTGLFVAPWLVFLIIAYWYFRARRLTRLRGEIPRWLLWLPAFGPLLRHFVLWLYLAVYEALLNAGAGHTDLDGRLDTVLFGGGARPPGGLRRELEALRTDLADAVRLGTAAQELEFRQRVVEENYSLALAQARERIGLAVRIVFAALVATLIFAVYLPLFQLGSVI